MDLDEWQPKAGQRGGSNGRQPDLKPLPNDAAITLDLIVNVSRHLREEFQNRRGYNPTPYLLVITGRAIGDGPTTDRFLWDIRRTISDLFSDNYYGNFAEFGLSSHRCHR